jgi:hypothetical protein
MTPDSNGIYNISDAELSDIDFAQITKDRCNEATEHWNTKEKLEQVRTNNRRQYLSEYVEDGLIDIRYQEVFSDNRQFQAIRTLVPFVTGQIAANEVTPANKDDLSMLFASDFETATQIHAERQNGKFKIRLSVQDLLIGERIGVGKWRYDSYLDTVVYERINPSKFVIGKRAMLYEEPDYCQHTLDKTPGDLIRQFPDKKEHILELFGVADSVTELEKMQHEITEDWIWVYLNGVKTLIVGWKYQEYVFGKIKNPNWKEGKQNIIDSPMVPFVFFNILNGGDGYIDETSFTEISKYSQSNYNKRGQVIAESAKYGGTGVPIFAKGAITQKDAARVKFSPVTRVLLDSADVSKAFTTWQQGPMQNFIMEDMANQKQNIADTYGATNVFDGSQSANKTATQDVLLRNQAEGRQGDLLDMVELAMTRFYMIEAQLMYIYFTDSKYYNYVGNDGEFMSVAVNQPELQKNAGISISVKAGSSLPLDRSQKRATINNLLSLNKIGTLQAYKELAIFDDPEKAFKQYVEEQTNAMGLVAEMNNDVFDRDANEDLQTVIGGKQPPERDDIDPEYVNFLNEFLLTDKFKMLQDKSPVKAAAVSKFIDAAIAKAQRKADKLALQPSPLAPGQSPTTPAQPPLPPGTDPNAPPGAQAAPGMTASSPQLPTANTASLSSMMPSAAAAVPM